MERRTLDIWVGLFTLAGIGALLVLALKVGNAGTYFAGDTYQIYAEFDNIGSLKARAPVKGAGVVVGRVDDIRFDPKRFVARVSMQIDRRYEFPVDSSASILTSGLLGEQYIGLDAGADEATLKNGDQIKLVQSAVVLERLIGQFMYGKASEGGAK